MGARGPRPVPTKILEMRGSWRAKTRKQEPKPVSQKPACPDWLDDAGKKLWAKLTKQLLAVNLLSAMDQHALGRYVVLFQRWRKMEDFIQQYGETYPIKGEKGEVIGFRVFYQVKLAQQLADSLLRLEQNFGMTPSARASLSVAPEKKATAGDSADKSRFFKQRA